MKYLYLKSFLFVLVCFFCAVSNSQTYITWDATDNFNLGVTGTAGTVNVTGTLTGTGNGVSFLSPAWNQANLIVAGNQTFHTLGPSSNPPSRDLTFTFSKPVIVTRYNMVDIDLNWALWGWNDTFLFNGVNFTNNPAPIGVNLNVNLIGATATTDLGGNAENASWFCSDQPITSFTIDYQTTGNLTHAYLGYSMEILIPPTINEPVCLNSVAPNFPVVGNNIQGTWLPSIIDTSILGNTIYTFTPNPDQPILCPIQMEVSVIDCCLPTLTSSTIISNMIQEERSDWISSSDLITFSDGILGNGVVYHAENFVELTHGFEAINGSQFKAYPEGCSGNFIYRSMNSQIIKPLTENFFKNDNTLGDFSYKNNPLFNMYLENEQLKVLLVNLYSNNVKIHSVDGKILFQDHSKNQKAYTIDISSFPKGVYLISALIGDNYLVSDKFIKN